MARIVIVDDEYFVRMGIKTIADRQEKGYFVIGEAENGTDAVNMILEKDPDIVFLDITMPGMNGLQVLETIRQKEYHGYVAMLTCHEDFQYAQQAVRYGADDYVLKNELVGDSMLTYLEKVTEKIRKKTEENDRRDVKEGERQKEQHFYKENFIKNVLQMRGMSKEEFIRGCKRYHIKIKADGIYMISIHIKEWERIVERYKDSSLQVFFKAVDHMMDEIFHDFPEWEGFYSEPFRYHILFTCSTEKSLLAVENQIRKIVNSISYHFETVLDIEIVTAVYRNVYPIEKLCEGYQKAGMLLEQMFFWKDKKLFWEGVQHTYQYAKLQKFEQLLEDDSNEKLLSVKIKEYLAEQKDSIIDVKKFLEIVRKKREWLAKRYEIETEFYVDGIRDIEHLLTDIMQLEHEIELEKTSEGYSFLVRQAIQIIKKEFTAKITLESVAEQLGISAGYFSRIFSGEMQEPFSSYVIRIRVEYAKELIATTNYKFYEIAEMCGFSSSVHFNNTFKKLCGVTPNQYRKER